METALHKWGNSHGVCIPRPLMKAVGLTAGAKLNLTLSEDETRLVITPVRPRRPIRGRYQIEELVKGHRKPRAGREVDWRPPQGKEAW